MPASSDTVDIQGRTVLVTGGTQGIGLAVAEAFLARGAHVMVCARTEPAAPASVDGNTAVFRCADIRDAQACTGLVEATVAEFGGLDVLVNNAGGSPNSDAATVSHRFVDKIVSLNLLAPFYLAQAANRVMRQQPSGGRIINIGSVSAHHPQPGTAAYSAAKAGLLGLTRALALEWAPVVRVNHITAGPVRPPGPPAVSREDAGTTVADVVPMGRPAAPSDVADTCLYLASDLASYLNGADIAVHGGGEFPARYLAAESSERG